MPGSGVLGPVPTTVGGTGGAGSCWVVRGGWSVLGSSGHWQCENFLLKNRKGIMMWLSEWHKNLRGTAWDVQSSLNYAFPWYQKPH